MHSMTPSNIHIEGLGWVEITRSLLEKNHLRVFLMVPAAEQPQVHRKIANIINGLNGRHVCFTSATKIVEFLIPSHGCVSFDWSHQFMKLFHQELRQEFDTTIIRWRQAR